MVKYAIIDSVSELSAEHENLWIFCGSHGGANATKHALTFNIAGIVFNDAGIGKDNAGVAGLSLCDQQGVPAACVDCHTARIGEGKETYQHGVVSKANNHALSLGISVGMPCNQVIEKLSKHKGKISAI
ncbi:hypothetical protein [Kaarinaea lacus]